MDTKELWIREIFSNVLEKILLTKKLEEVSSSEIIALSGLSRTTFYRYFRDKYDLALWRFEHFYMTLMAEHGPSGEGRDNMGIFLKHIDDNREFYKRVLKYSGQNSFASLYQEKMYEWARASREARNRGEALSISDIYLLNYHIAGLLYILDQWVQSNDPITPEELYPIIVRCRKNSFPFIYGNNSD